MKNIIKISAFIVLFITVSGCNKSKSNYNFGFKIKEKLFVEVYNVGLLRSLTTHYLTDSSTFRLYIGTLNDEEQGYNYKCIGDSVFATQFFNDSANRKKRGTTTVFSLSKLKANNVFQ